MEETSIGSFDEDAIRVSGLIAGGIAIPVLVEVDGCVSLTRVLTLRNKNITNEGFDRQLEVGEFRLNLFLKTVLSTTVIQLSGELFYDSF